ncbi:MAG: HlyD family efflux transporter periplasmic adaptor subunit [Sedimentisphaerales bacterium]|nr:HlyD family efflux transporter periplasmic adaptor subunit [Sedimentisphaerales bacterium]
MSANKKGVISSNKPEYHKPKKGKAGMWLILILLIAALAGAGFWATTRLNPVSASTGATFTVGNGPLTITVTEGGSIRAQNSIQYKCQVERNRDVQDITILNIVSPGTYITQEDVDNRKILVELDSSVLEDRLVQEKLSLTSDEERVTSARESFQIQLIDNESSISRAELNVRFALLDLQKYLGEDLADELIVDVNVMLPAVDSNSTTIGTEKVVLADLIYPLVEQIKDDPNVLSGSSAWQQLKSRQDDIVIAEGNLKTQQDTLEGTRRLHDANYVSDLELQRDELSLKSRKFSLQNSEINLALFLDYDFPKSAEQSLSDYIEARRSLQRTYAQCRSREAQAKSSLSSALLRYDEQVKQVNLLEQQIKYCTIRAKAPGLVVYGEGNQNDTMRMMRGGGGRTSGGSGMIAEGEAVYEGQTIISMPDTASMVAEISVHETEVDKVRTGQKATIVMDAFPDTVLEGEVLEVAPLPDQSRGMMNPDTKVYQTLVKINGTHEFLKSRMSCKVNILVEKYDDVVQVPVQVVSNRLGRKICYVVKSGEPVEREVQTGAFNETFVQIKSGLETGEVVLLNPLPFTDSAAASFLQIPPVPDGEAPPVDITQSPRGGMIDGAGAGFGGGRGMGGMRGMENLTPEERQQMMEQFQQRGGAGPGGAGGFGGGRRGGGGMNPQGAPGGSFDGAN